MKDRFSAFGKSYVVDQEFGRISPRDIGEAAFLPEGAPVNFKIWIDKYLRLRYDML